MRIWCKHSVLYYFPEDRNCEICQRTKITRAPCRRCIGGAVPRAEIFGDLITADHKVLSDNCESRNNHRYAIVVQDLATQLVQSYPCKTKTSQKHKGACLSSWSRIRSLKSVTLTIPWNLAKLVKIFPGIIVASTPHRSETNGIAERAVRIVKEGTSAVLLQSGLNIGGQILWNAVPICETSKISCPMGKLHTRDVLGNLVKGPIIPSGSLVEYYPISAKDQSRIHQFGKKVLPGLFLGDALCAGGIWKGDILVADIEELETMDASEIHSRRLNAQDVIFPEENGKFIFPAADG